MIPQHVSTAADPFDRGKELGAAFREPLRNGFEGYQRLFAEHGAAEPQVREWGAAALDAARGWAPDLAAEMDGFAEGSGLAPWQVGALNGRTEVLAAVRAGGEGECSTAVVRSGGAPVTVQTWDWLDWLRAGMLLWTIEGPDGPVRTFTEVGIVGKIGVSGHGVGVHFNVLRHATDSADIGVPVHVVARRILDEARSTADAVALARSARLSASTVLTVVTADDAVVLELSPAGVGVVHPDAAGTLLHTNHFLDAALAPGERTLAHESTSYDRLDQLRALAGALGVEDHSARAHLLRSHGSGAVCAHADPAQPLVDRWESLATIALDVTNGRLHAHTGGPCRVTADTWQTLG
ncbi:C45 family autoproteolytic acyltransferase/hydolase [Pseudonocardia sp. TRM90224]|uniref:C45 family autoproteolytic acyltransferase/hydolase n=1 Tax=Pseudonocardia sp. TRM90224 TaxID=2812678 RepID=UPI001E58159D|nr:C45 family peptidase [Pseudonocardia sp. TRM90224]